jgi:hypothetical protein
LQEDLEVGEDKEEERLLMVECGDVSPPAKAELNA